MKRNKRTLEDLKNSTLIPVMLVPERIPVSLATVRAWVFQGKLPVIRIGRKVFIRKEVLEKIEMGGFETVSGEQNICPSPLTILGDDCDLGGKILDFDDNNRVANSDLLKSFNEYTLEHKPNHWNWGPRQFLPQFKKQIPFEKPRRIASGGRECEFPSLNECKLYFAEKYSLDSDVFEIN